MQMRYGAAHISYAHGSTPRLRPGTRGREAGMEDGGRGVGLTLGVMEQANTQVALLEDCVSPCFRAVRSL